MAFLGMLIMTVIFITMLASILGFVMIAFALYLALKALNKF